MTHPLTPREKVVFKQPCENCQRMTTVDLNAVASGSGDHAELARLADDLRKFEHHSVGSLKISMDEVRRIIAVCDAHAALLTENAALRADGEIYQNQADHEFLLRKEAERKLAEAVGLLRRIGFTPDGKDGLGLSEIVIAARTFVSKEAERG